MNGILLSQTELGMDPSPTTYYLYGTEQLTEPLTVCFLIYKVGTILVPSS